MNEDTPDLKEFCFGPEAMMPPAAMLALWARTYLTSTQFQEFRRLINETLGDGVTASSVEQMIGIIEMSKFLAD